MNKKFRIVSALAIIFALSTVVLASARLVNIKVAYDNIKVVVDGREVQFGLDSTGKKLSRSSITEQHIFQSVRLEKRWANKFNGTKTQKQLSWVTAWLIQVK